VVIRVAIIHTSNIIIGIRVKINMKYDHTNYTLLQLLWTTCREIISCTSIRGFRHPHPAVYYTVRGRIIMSQYNITDVFDPVYSGHCLSSESYLFYTNESFIWEYNFGHKLLSANHLARVCVSIEDRGEQRCSRK
jgi:hypothetical protein